jgi:hypothetical protein
MPSHQPVRVHFFWQTVLQPPGYNVTLPLSKKKSGLVPSTHFFTSALMPFTLRLPKRTTTMEKLNQTGTTIFCTLLKTLGKKRIITLKAPGMYNLTIRSYPRQLITPWGKGIFYTVAHEYKMNGDHMREPEMGFIVVDNRQLEEDYFLIGIYPHQYYHDSIGVWQESVLIDDRKITGVFERLQLKHCAFANEWMEAIKAHGFLR